MRVFLPASTGKKVPSRSRHAACGIAKRFSAILAACAMVITLVAPGARADRTLPNNVVTTEQDVQTGKQNAAQAGASRAGDEKPEPPSTHLKRFQNDVLELRYPDNWKSATSDSTFSLVPLGGAVKDANGQSALAYGVIFDSFSPQTDANNRITIEEATNQLVASLRKANPKVREVRDRKRTKIDDTNALSTYLTNDSPAGGNEKDWLVAIARPDGLAYFICVVPEKDFDSYDAAFQSVITSVRFRK